MGDTNTYYVYILASGRHGTLYIGVTNNLRTRLEQHRSGRGSEFVRQEVHSAPTRLCRNIRVAAGCHRKRKAIEELAPRLENTFDRKRKPGLERPFRPRLMSVVMGPGLRRDDERWDRCLGNHIADTSLSPQ
jgi:predicted GIY-YIG superfamily endonuclease